MMSLGKENSGKYRRFVVYHRILHFIVIITFTLLSITGFTLYFSHLSWVRAIGMLFGNATGLAWIHRVSATIFYICVMLHILFLAYHKLVKKGRIFGPQSLFPSLKDFQDIYQNILYIFGKGAPAKYNRFSYLQKVDYWAVLLGMQSMGITGIIMWYPEYFASILPGFFVNIANELHFHEAILAVMYIGFVHMTDTHLTPESFPLEKSIFSGWITKEDFMLKHAGEWELKRAESESSAPEIA
ncbi:MAG TPA: hypothetical protein DCY12_02415 [Candidatus Atribacteria bacterium]|nr:hypothetical protein [Candidatus Atribacteria bacterium]